MAKAKDFYSKNVTEAIRQACAEFSTSQENLDIEVMETGSAGIFGLCRKRAHIRVTRKQAVAEEEPRTSVPARSVQAAAPAEEKQEPELPSAADAGEEAASAEPVRGKGRRERKRSPKAEQVAAPAVAPAAPTRSPEPVEPFEPPTEEVLARIQSDLAQTLQLMGYGSEVKVHFAENAVQCHISGEHEEQIVGPDGRTLDSLQYLLRKMLSQVLPDRMNVALDIGNFRERRTEELKKMAVALAEQVKEDGKTQSIPALNPSERRVVHVVLQDDKGVRSRSVGEGLFKKVLIYKPGNKVRKSGSRRRGRQGGGSEEQ
ncbi:MAG TPA: RNA-binding protein [Desulfobulbaceae bacterium]|nr:RNA-binding protein [Desulfobulbaceae bacterium]